jgi:hypothetical protein
MATDKRSIKIQKIFRLYALPTMFVVILLVLFLTNPAVEVHREEVKKMYSDKLSALVNENNNNVSIVFGKDIAALIGDRLIDNMVSRDNYILFSTTKITIFNKSITVGIGVLGKVFIKDIDDVEQKINTQGSLIQNQEKKAYEKYDTL